MDSLNIDCSKSLYEVIFDNYLPIYMKYWAKVEFGTKTYQTLNTITKPVLKEVTSGNKLE